MILRSMEITNYRRFEHFDLRLRPGFTVVKGPNEAGKSTMQHALMLALFGDVRSRSATAAECRRWGQDSFYRITLEFDWSGQAYRLEKDFDAKTEKLTNLVTGEESSERQQISRQLSAITGLPTEELFRATACVTQSSIASISAKGKQQISEQLQSIITGGGEDTSGVRTADLLDARAAELRKGLDRPATNPGLIRQSTDRMGQLQQELSTRKAELTSLDEALETAAETGSRIAAKLERLAAITALLSNWDKRATALAARSAAAQSEDALQAEIEAVERLRSTVSELKKAEKAFDKFPAMSPDTPQRLAALDTTLRVHGSMEAEAESELEKLESNLGGAGSLGRLLPGFFACCIGVAGIFALFAGHLVVAGVSVAIAVALFLLHISRTTQAKDASERVSEARTRLEKTRQQLRQALQEQEGLVRDSGANSADELLRRWSDWSEIKSDIARSEAALEGKLSGRDSESLASERRRLSKLRRDAEELLESDDLKAADFDALERQQYSIESDKLKQELIELERTHARAQAVSESARTDINDVYRLEEELQAEQENLRRSDRLAKVYTAAAQGVRDAVAQTLSGAKSLLESRTGEYLAAVTGGKYARVEVDQRTLGFEVYSNDKNDLVDVDGGELSRGAADQFYLAARLAMLDLICGDKRPPIFLDDPFVTFDDDRAARAIDACKRMSRDRQVLLFTCSGRYDASADNKVELS